MATPQQSSDDVTLLTAWRGGDLSAGEQLIDRHYDAVVRFFRTKTDHDSEDLVQRTFLICTDKQRGLRSEGSFAAFLFGIARNVLFEHIRGRARARELDFGVSNVVDFAPGVSTAYVQRAEQRLLIAALQRIPLELQIAVELYYWEDLSVAELANVLEVPEGTVKSRLHRARTLLAATMHSLPGAAGDKLSLQVLFDSWARGVRAPDPAGL